MKECVGRISRSTVGEKAHSLFRKTYSSIFRGGVFFSNSTQSLADGPTLGELFQRAVVCQSNFGIVVYTLGVVQMLTITMALFENNAAVFKRVQDLHP